MAKKKEYNVEQSPFYKRGMKLRANLKELEASNGEEVVLARKRYFKQDEYAKFIINDKFDIVAFDKTSNTAKTVLQYILYHCLEYNTPTFRLKAETLGRIIEKDTSVIYKGIKTLIDIKYISKTRTKETYWINHNYFYKGNFIVDKFLVTKN